MRFKALDTAKENGNELDYFRKSAPVCPHCGETFDIHENEAWSLYDREAENVDIDCDSCLQPFTVEVYVVFRYSTNDSEYIK